MRIIVNHIISFIKRIRSGIIYITITSKDELSKFDRLLNYSVGIIVISLVIFSIFFTKNLTFLLMSIFFLVILLILHNFILLRVKTEEKKSKEKAERLNNLQELSFKLTSTLSSEEVLKLIPEAAITLAKVEACLVEIIDKKEERLIPYTAVGITTELSIIKEEGNPLSERVVKGKGALSIPELAHEINVPDWVYKQGFKVYQGIPLKVRNEVIGVINLFSATPKIFSTEEVEILSILGTQAASAIENARLYEVTKEALHKEITSSIALYRIEQAITSKFELEEQISVIIEGCVQATDAECGSLWLIDELSGNIVCKMVYPPEKHISEVRLKLGEGITGWVAKHGRLQNIKDLSQEPRFINVFNKNLRTQLSVPLIWKKEIIGVINVFNKRADKFDQEDEKILNILSSQAAMTLQSARLYKELRNAASALALLYEVSKTINEGRSHQEILELILKKGMDVFDAQNGSIMLLDETTGEMTIRVAVGLSEEIIKNTRKRPGDGSIAGWVAKEKEPLLLIGKVDDPRFKAVYKKEGIKDAMCAPLKIRDKLLGVLSISNQIGHDVFTESDLNFLCTLANEVSIVLETARLYELTSQRVTELSAFYVISNALSSILDFREVLNQIMDRISAIIPHAIVIINTPDYKKNVLKRIADFGFGVNDIKPAEEIKLNDKLKDTITSMFNTRRPVALQNVMDIPEVKPLVGSIHVNSLILLPLIAKEHEIGILTILSKIAHTPSKEELRLLMAIAQAAATAIENARIYEILKKKVEELEGLQELASKMSINTSSRDVLANAINVANHVIRSELGLLYIWDEDTGEYVARVGQGKRRMSERAFRALRFKPEEGVVGWVGSHNEPVIVENVRHDARFIPLPEITVREEVCVPIVEAGKVVGVMEFFDKLIPGGFVEEDKKFLTILASQVGIFLGNIKAFEEIKRRALQLSTVHAINKITSGVETKNILPQILELTAKVMRVKKAYYSSLIPEENMIKIECSYGLTYMEQEREEKLPLGKGISGRVIQNNMPIVINNIKEDTTLSDEEKNIYIEDSYLSVPLCMKNKPVGSLNVSAKLTGGGFDKQDVELLSTIAVQTAIAIEYFELFHKLQEYNDEILKLLVMVIETRDPFIRRHSEAVCKYAVGIARELKLSDDDVETIRKAALFHDIGKIGIKESILLKSENEINSEEFREIKNHPFIGIQILKSLNLLSQVIPLVYHHHEMYDGTGYPDGLSGENIHIGARILAVADTFDNMVTSKGSYIGLSDEEAIGILRKNSGKKFDPIVVEAFIRIHPVVRREEIEKGRLKKREIREEGKKEIRIGTHTVWERYT